MKTHRLARIAEAIREVAAETILFEMNDPRIKMVTVTRAEVTADLQHAKVYVSIMGSEKEQKLTMHGLRHATGYIQSKLAKRLQTRFTPIVTFVEDEGVKKSIEMTRLINEALGPAPGAEMDEAAGQSASDDEGAEGTAGQGPTDDTVGPEGSPAT